MEPVYDLFSRLPNGSPLWLESIEGFEKAERRLDVLVKLHPRDEYFIYSEKCGEVVRRIPHEEHPPTVPENHSWL